MRLSSAPVAQAPVPRHGVSTSRRTQLLPLPAAARAGNGRSAGTPSQLPQQPQTQPGRSEDASPSVLVQVAPARPDAPPQFAALNLDTVELLPRFNDTDDLLEGLDGVDDDTIATDSRQIHSGADLEQQQQPVWPPARHAAAAVPADVAVPDARLVTDPEELQLIGQGLPIFQGEEWPQLYWRALSDINRGADVVVPTPHPKFSMQDLRRLAAEGPRFNDLVLEHAELINDPRPPAAGVAAADAAAEAFNYVPLTVLGDYHFDAEPDWTALPQMSRGELLAGLQQRNWTHTAFRPESEPWRLQFFRCGYSAVSGWPGWRALVTTRAGTRVWADLPGAGPEVYLEDYQRSVGSDALWKPKRLSQSGDATGMEGFNQAFEQVFQAFEQRLPVAALHELTERGAVTPGAYPYDCPGDALLDVSWHVTPNDVTDPLTTWLINPTIGGVVDTIRTAVTGSGLQELRSIRDALAFKLLPPLPVVPFAWNPNNAGPLYFLVVLTAGVVIPSLRRSRILDIKTLEEDPGAAQEFARSKASARKEGMTGVEFKDIAGLDPILGEVLEVVEFLRDPKAFSKLGARPPKGILLEGDPGTGKTLMAKALAGEAMVPFYQMTGTEFTEGIVGLGAARVRDLFKRARVAAPCVIFVDELDALGLKRASGDGNANEEREQTLNQLLTEMDGFTPDTGVVFIGATNRADLLDPALMRPGRFDRKVRMPRPDTEGRYDILRLQLAGKDVAPDVELLQLARDLPGLVGADLANIVNEAQLNAVRAGRSQITKKDMYAGVDRFTQGETRPPLPTSHRLPLLAFTAKEVGIALVATVLRTRHGRIEPVERVSVQPKGRSYSRTLFARGTDEDYAIITRGRLLDRLRVALAGSAATALVLGEQTNFAAADLKRARRLAERFVCFYGMSDFGITAWAQAPYSHDFAVGSNRPRKVVSVDAMDATADWPTRVEELRFDPLDPSDPTWQRYMDAVRCVIRDAHDDAWAILTSHRDALNAGVATLSQVKELLGSELREVFDAHPPTPPGSAANAPASPLADMQVWTPGGRTDPWPYGVEWYRDTYPKPHWAAVREAAEAARAAGATSGMSPAAERGSA